LDRVEGPPILKMTESEKDLQIYEVGFHILPTVEEANLSEVLVKIKDGLAEKGAELISEDFPKLRPLAFTMVKEIQGKKVKFNKAYFGAIKFELDREALVEVDKLVKNNPEILRYIIVKTVRENTVYYSKNLEAVKEEGGDKAEDKPVKEVSAEEIDKSIEELVIN
jgi:ribosomal protein S6